MGGLGRLRDRFIGINDSAGYGLGERWHGGNILGGLGGLEGRFRGFNKLGNILRESGIPRDILRGLGQAGKYI